MATQEKLRKSLEALRNLTKSNQQSSDVAKKKEKIQHCYVITEAISNPTIRISTDFHILLSNSIEAFLRLCDDQDSDVRMTSEECLNRIIRAANDGYIGKIQIELHKEIKKNGAARPLRTALWLFSILAHRIRPHKGKPYVANLFPSLIRIAERTEESVHETLALSLPRIMYVLGSFSTENEIKSLLKAFLSNCTNQSAVIRRTTSSCILSICMNCRKPYNFIIYCLNYLLDSLIPVAESHSNHLILGVMSCTKMLLPNLKSSYINQECVESNWTITEITTEKFLQIYELCLHFLTNKDHNIVNVCLETLNVLLQNCTDHVKEILLNNKGIGHSRINSTQSSSKSNPRSPSQLSVATNVTAGEENLFSESELTETIRSDIEKWIDTSKLSVMNITFAKTKEKSLSLDKMNMCMTTDDIPNICDYEVIDIVDDNCDSKLKASSIGDNLDKQEASENSSEKSLSCIEDKILNVEIDAQEIDIGEYLDNHTPLLYCTRLITKLFLLSGTPQTCLPDKLVRVSVKSLALSCLSSIFLIYPSGFLANLDKHYSDCSKLTNKKICSQQISDVLLFKCHNDPQLRGAVRNLTANFIKAVLISSEGDYEKWILDNVGAGRTVNFSIAELIKIFVEGLEDESANCIRQTLLSLRSVLKNLSESQKSALIIPLLNTLPLLSKNPYWLVKVALCELVSKIDYITVRYITESSEFQNKVIYCILLELLGDNDQRVRTSAANSIVQIISVLYFEDYQIRESEATSKAICERNVFVKSFSDTKKDMTANKRHFVDNMPFPFNKLDAEGCERIDFALSKIVAKLYNIVLTATSKHLISGCIETLSLLSNSYPCTVYKDTWCTSSHSSEAPKSIPDLLSLCISLLTTSIHVYDLQSHINILNLATNLYAGQSLSLLKPVVEAEGKLWDMFTNNTYCEISEQYLTHIIKLLNIFHHVLSEITPVNPQSKVVLPNLPTATSLSPLKRRKSDLDKKVLSGKFEKDEKTEKKETSKLNSLGSFVTFPHYLKLFDMLRSSFMNYKISLDSEASEKFLELLNKTVQSLSVVMEIGTLNEFSRIAEDVLGYLRSTFAVDAPATVECVQQLLKCLFSTNLTSNITEFVKENKSTGEEEEENYGFYFNIFQKPYSDISNFINSLNNISRYYCDGDSTVMGYLHRKDVKKRPVVLSRSSDKILANYIRIFEPMVIKSLKQYTITSNVKLQCRILQLLNQLVQLRVNYCLLDSEQVFIGFVLKQFEYIEEGQIPLPEELIPKIFQFLVQLSYSKQHSKCIIGVPKIIQLCDGLMASGQPPLTHCIPALEPIVEDIFLTRNKSNTSDIKELETTREVLLPMLLRLCEFKQVVSLLTMVLEDSKYCADNTEKWLGWSRQVLRVVLPMLKENKIRLDTSEDFVAMRRFVLSLEPNVFKPFDEIVVMFFQEPPVLENSGTFNRWLSKILIILLILTPLKEDTLLAKINRLKSEFSPNSIFENVVTKADPLNVNNNADTFEKIPAELIFIRFIFRVISLTSKQCLVTVRSKENNFLIEQFSCFLMHCLYIFQSGSHCKITNKCITILNKNIPFDENDVIQLKEMNRNFLNLAVFHPILTFHWCYFLTLMNYSDRWFWTCILRLEETVGNRLKNPSINLQIMKMGGVISFCDYLSEDLGESENLTWFLTNISEFLVTLSNEAPIFEFISSIHRNSKLSKIFIENISRNCSNVDSAVFKTKLLKCIENCHSSQIGPVLNLLVPNMLNYRQVALSRLAANLASRKIEFLLTLPMEEVNNQLSKDDIIKMQKTLMSLHLVKKHETLISLLNKLSMQYYDLSPLEFAQRRVVNPEYIKRLKINKKWYLSQIQGRYSEANIGRETAKLLSHLEYNEIISFMSSSDFNKVCLQDCIKLGLKYFEQHNAKEEPAILKACSDCLLKDITSIVTRIPTPHQVYSPIERVPSSLELRYFNELTDIFRNDDFSNLLGSIAPCIPHYMEYLLLSPNLKIPEKNYKEIMKFGVTCLEYVHFLIKTDKKDFNINLIDTFVNAAETIFKQNNICTLLACDANISWFCSSVNSIFRFVKLLVENDRPLPSLPKHALRNSLGSDDLLCASEATYHLYILVSWLFETKSTNVNIPIFFLMPIKSIIVSLSRFPVVNSIVLMPSRVLITGRMPEASGTFNTQVPPLPIEVLQEIDVLEEYIFRITLLGWTSRQQFEETWMCLLSVLCAPLDNLDALEINDMLHSSSLAIKGITALLLETLKYPSAGHPNISNLIHISRNLPINEETIGMKKLRKVQESIKFKYQESAHVCKNSKVSNVFEYCNFEKSSCKYSYGQISIKYFLLATGIIQEDEDNSPTTIVLKRRNKMLEEAGLDINSCLQFLLDYYTQLMKPQSLTNIRVLHEAIRSTVIISDLFTDKSQFTWMMDVFLELSKLHAVEDELLHQYLIVGICKAVGVLTPDLETYEQVKKMLVQYLKSPYLSSRIASLYGLLYILEGCKLSNITIGGISDEMQLMLPCAVEYVQFNINTSNSVLRKSQEHSMLLWALAFYLVENIDEVHMEQNFVSNTLASAFNVLGSKITNQLHYSIVKGIERLVIVKKSQILEKFGKQILKLALDKMKCDNPTVAILGTQLLLSYMYTDCSHHLQNSQTPNMQTSPDHLVQTIEKISAIFERIKRGYIFEVDILCSIIPNILDDFFSPSDILTKVIGEFLSPQQPHPQLLSKVVFRVFESAIRQEQLPLLQDWVVFSLSNFTQSFSIGMATWCLTCFFISASSNDWLRSYFPYIQTRVGRYEYEDKKLLCITGADFYSNLPNETQKQKFVDNFKKVKDQPDTPFNDLLSSL
ncbi:huntingtin [Anoplophora glabripennis]|nr:huntingtin [Anoplophora glabripennis]